MSRFADVVVVGGGLAGTAAVVALARRGHSVIHIAPEGPSDRRTSALMMPSVDFLRAEGLVADPETLGHRLSAIRLIDATGRLIRAPETLFEAREAGLQSFGWNFPNAGLLAHFAEVRAALPPVETLHAAVTDLERVGAGWRLTLTDGQTVVARLVVGADGKKSLIRAAGGFRGRETGFAEAALVADLELERPLGETSVEFHYRRGPFTLVPAGGTRANLVYIDDRAVLRSLQEQGREALMAAFYDKSQHLFGRLSLLTPAHMFMLSALSVPMAGKDGLVLVGEAAHAFPPIGAQGLNLGLRDVADLVAALDHAESLGAGRGDPDWADAVSARYGETRGSDIERTGGMVDALFRSLTVGFLPAQAVRAGGIWALKLSKTLRHVAFDAGMGLR